MDIGLLYYYFLWLIMTIFFFIHHYAFINFSKHQIKRHLLLNLLMNLTIFTNNLELKNKSNH